MHPDDKNIRSYLPRSDVRSLLDAFAGVDVAKQQLAKLPPLPPGRERPGMAQLATAPPMVRRSIMRAIGPPDDDDHETRPTWTCERCGERVLPICTGCPCCGLEKDPTP